MVIYVCSGRTANAHLGDEESPLGQWSSGIGFNSSVDSSIKEAEYEDQTSPSHAL